MIRDDKMMQLVAPEKEPITPFVRVVRSLYDDHGISSVLVMGGSGDYFDVADNVMMMDCYKCLDVTERAKQIAASSSESKLPHTASARVPFREFQQRYPIGSAYSANGKVKVASRSVISYAETELDLSGLEQIVSRSQTSAIAQALQRLPSIATDRNNTLREVLQALDKAVDEGGLDVLAPNQFHGGLARPRRFELVGAINRFRRDESVVQKR
jgi:predicted ABC-class ATPase